MDEPVTVNDAKTGKDIKAAQQRWHMDRPATARIVKMKKYTKTAEQI